MESLKKIGKTVFSFFMELSFLQCLMLECIALLVGWHFRSGIEIFTNILPAWAVTLLGGGFALVVFVGLRMRATKVVVGAVGLLVLVLVHLGTSSVFVEEPTERLGVTAFSFSQIAQTFAWACVLAYVIGGVVAVLSYVDWVRAAKSSAAAAISRAMSSPK